MKTTYYYIAAAAALAFLLYKRSKQDPTANGAKGVSKVDEAHPDNGTDWPGDIMSRLAGADMQSPNHANLLPGANADGGGHTAQSLGLNVGWDGTLA